MLDLPRVNRSTLCRSVVANSSMIGALEAINAENDVYMLPVKHIKLYRPNFDDEERKHGRLF